VKDVEKTLQKTLHQPCKNPAGVPGLEPRMAEPESAVLPITPYPIGCLKRLVKGFPQTM
jgi:hypothetical protein